jgi:hypothetical protein
LCVAYTNCRRTYDADVAFSFLLDLSCENLNVSQFPVALINVELRNCASAEYTDVFAKQDTCSLRLFILPWLDVVMLFIRSVITKRISRGVTLNYQKMFPGLFC